MIRKSILSLACLLATAVAPAAALAGDGAVKQRLISYGHISCATGGIGAAPVGFVVLDRTGDRVTAVIKLHGAPANGLWLIELNQTPLMGCYNEVYNRDGRAALIETNAQGNGSAVVSVPYAPGNTGAFVLLTSLNDAAKAIRYVASEGTELS